MSCVLPSRRTSTDAATDNGQRKRPKAKPWEQVVVARVRTPPPFSITFHSGALASLHPSKRSSPIPDTVTSRSVPGRSATVRALRAHRPVGLRSATRPRGLPAPGALAALGAPLWSRVGPGPSSRPYGRDARPGTATGAVPADARHAAAPVDSITVRRAGATQSNRSSLQLTQLMPRSSAVNAIRHMLYTHAHAHRAGVQDVHSTEESLGTYSHPGRFGSVRRCGGSAQARACARHDIFMVMSH